MPSKFIRKKIKCNDLMFFMAYGLFLVAGILSILFYYKYYLEAPHKVMIVGIFLLLVYKKLCENRMTRRSLLNLVVDVEFFSLVNNIISVSVAVKFILIWSARKIDLKRITRGGHTRYYLDFRYSLYGLAVLYNITIQDCGYLNVLQYYGVLVLIICLTSSALLVRCYKKKNYYLLIMLTFVALHAMIDNLIINLFYNSLWFVLVAPIEEYAVYIQKIRGRHQQSDNISWYYPAYIAKAILPIESRGGVARCFR